MTTEDTENTERENGMSNGVEMLTNQSDSVALYQKLCEAVCEIEGLRRDLDEARELLASEKITRDHIIKRGIDIQKERDEAREAADNLVEYAWQSLAELEKFGKGYARYEREMNEIRVDIARVNWKDGAQKEGTNKKHLCDSHRDMLGNCIVCQMEARHVGKLHSMSNGGGAKS